MGMTMAEKIISAHAGVDRVEPGELVEVRVDFVMANDITAALAIREFEKLEIEGVFDQERVAFVADHFVPPPNIKAAEQCQAVRSWARRMGILYFEGGRDGGIEHIVLPEQGLVLPGEIVIGADSHTCTYGALGAFATGVGSTDAAVAMATGQLWLKVPSTMKLFYQGTLRPWVTAKDLILHTIGRIGVDGALYMAMYFTGPVISQLSMDARFTITNMAIEAGAKTGLMDVDEKTLEFVRPRARRPFTVYRDDPDARYEVELDFNVSDWEPTVAAPHLPSNVQPVAELSHIRIDQVFIGSCTNGRIEDLRLAARILQGQRVHPEVRCIIIPGSGAVYRQALAEGLIDIFVEAGAVVGLPSCGPCMGGYSGVLGPGERCVSTTNRNFVGRMGHPTSEVYLANPAVAAASAILGRIASPEEVPATAVAA
jgi:3-isopropylmalate/(R)-2-methylmalate dehydratase large subunit